jgi:hypothetical protein
MLILHPSRLVVKCLACVLLLYFSLALPANAQRPTTTLKTIVPEEIDGPLSNPYMGWGLWAGPRYLDGRSFTLGYNTTGFGDDAPMFGWVLIDWMWADLEPQEGQYYWKDLDTIINYWAARGKQIDLRVWITDDPGWNGAPGNQVCPDWLWQSGAKYREYKGEGNSQKREPDYADPTYESIYLPKVRKFLAASADRYDKPESPVVMWGAMGYGQWGEWHTGWSRYPWPNVEFKHKVLAEVVDMYSDIFKEKPLRIACAPEDNPVKLKSLSDYLYNQGVGEALSKGWALAYHAFIDGQGLYCKQLFQGRYRQTPMWAESSWTYMQVKDQPIHGTLDEYLRVYTDWHANYAHYYMDAESYKRAMREDRTHFEKGLQSGGLGYRLVLTRASWRDDVPAGDLFLLDQEWVNRNVGRLYKRHPLKLYLTDTTGKEKFAELDHAFDETNWIKGESYPVISVLHLPKELTPGTYDMRIALVDETGQPRIKLAIAGADPQGRYKLGTMRVLPPEALAGCGNPRCP